MRQWLARLLGPVVVLMTLTSCSLAGELLTQSTAIVIDQPRPEANVTLPLTVSWTSTISASRYAVLIDATPPGPGDRLDPHAQPPGNLFVTSAHSVRIAYIVPLAGSDDAERNYHQIVIIALDSQNRRVGEDSGYVELHVTSP